MRKITRAVQTLFIGKVKLNIIWTFPLGVSTPYNKKINIDRPPRYQVNVT